MLLCVFCCKAISFAPLTSRGARASIFLVETISRQIIYRRMAFCAAMATCDNAISARRLRPDDDDGIGFFISWDADCDSASVYCHLEIK
jgi:hypothetical protein